MKDLLERDFAVGQEQVHAITRKSRVTQRRGETLADPEHRHPELLVQVCQVRCVPLGDDKEVPIGHGLDVHEGEEFVVLVHPARLHGPGYHPAEDTVIVTHGLQHA